MYVVQCLTVKSKKIRLEPCGHYFPWRWEYSHRYPQWLTSSWESWSELVLGRASHFPCWWQLCLANTSLHLFQPLENSMEAEMQKCSSQFLSWNTCWDKEVAYWEMWTCFELIGVVWHLKKRNYFFINSTFCVRIGVSVILVLQNTKIA